MRALILAVALAVSFSARAELHTISFGLQTYRSDDTTVLDPSEIKSHRLQCGLGEFSPAPAGWIIDEEIPMPTLAKIYDFGPTGTWNCHAWVVLKNGMQSGDTPDLVFTIPLVAPPSDSTVNPKPPVLTIQ